MLPHLFLAVVVFTPVQDKAERIKALETEITALETKLDALRKELQALRPTKRLPVPHLLIPRLEIGQTGPFFSRTMVQVDFKVDRILNAKEMIVYPHDRFSDRIIVRMDTSGLAEGRYLRLDGSWEVAETKRVGGRTYYVLRKAD